MFGRTTFLNEPVGWKAELFPVRQRRVIYEVIQIYCFCSGAVFTLKTNQLVLWESIFQLTNR